MIATKILTYLVKDKVIDRGLNDTSGEWLPLYKEVAWAVSDNSRPFRGNSGGTQRTWTPRRDIRAIKKRSWRRVDMKEEEGETRARRRAPPLIYLLVSSKVPWTQTWQTSFAS